MKAINKTLTYVACAAMMLSQVVTLTSCKNEEDNLFDSSAAERLMQTEKDYTQRLAASEGGWAFEYYPTQWTINPNEDAEAEYLPQGLGYLMMTKFNKDNSVVVGMNNAFTNNSYKEDSSAWEIISDNGPVLTFNTFNDVLHTFSNPYGFTNSLGSGDDGEGVGGDYEFVVIECKENADRVTLKGKKRGTYSYLYRLPAGTNFEEYIADVQAFSKTIFPSSAINYNCMHVGSKTYNMVDMAGGDPNIYPADGDIIGDQSFHPYMIVKKNDGKYYIHFRDPFEVEEEETTVQEFAYDEASESFICTSNEEYSITGPNMNVIFMNNIQSGYRWNFNASSDCSSAFASALSAVSDDASKISYTYSGSQIVFDGGEIRLDMSFTFRRNGKNQTATAGYYFGYDVNENGVKLMYEQPASDQAATVLTNIPAISNLLNLLTADCTFEAVTSKFVANTLKLKAGNEYITITYSKK